MASLVGPLGTSRSLWQRGPGVCQPRTPPDARYIETVASGPGKKEQQDGGDVLVERERKTERARRYSVIFHNDDYTTREFVVHVLMRYFSKSETEATHLMLTVHHKGRGVAGVYVRDLAETKAQQTMDYAAQHGFPLKVTAEPCD